MKTAQRSRLEFLDAIRGLAAFAVVMEHGLEVVYPGYLKSANRHFTLGVFGVAAFFLVSGFIIPISIERHSSLKQFWTARFFRLYPLYWFSLLAGVAYGALGLLPLPSGFSIHPLSITLANLTMFQTYLGIPNIVGVTWTLALELAFYVLCSVLFFFGSLGHTARWAWTAIIGNLLLNTVAGIGFHQSLPAGKTGLLVTSFFGTVLYRANQGEISYKAVWRMAPFLCLSLFVGFWFRFQTLPATSAEDRFTFSGVTASYLGAYSLFVVLYAFRNRQFPAPLLWLGRISYSLYLLHGFVMSQVLAFDRTLTGLAMGFALSVGVSALTFRYIEQPAIAFHRSMSNRLRSAAATGELGAPQRSLVRSEGWSIQSAQAVTEDLLLADPQKRLQRQIRIG